MKFKYVGDDGFFCLELLAYKLVPMGSKLKNGDVIEVPNDNTRLIEGMKMTDYFQEVQDKKVIKKENK